MDTEKVQKDDTVVEVVGEDGGETQTTAKKNIDLDSLPKPLKCLRFKSPENSENECVFYILGTAHVSRTSCDDTTKLIQLIKPDLVMVELCSERQGILTRTEEISNPSLTSVLHEIRSGKVTAFQGIYSWLLARVGSGVDVLPGEEFRVAVREAQAIDAGVVLGDRPVSITLARVWAALSLWEKWKLSGHLLWTGFSLLDIDELKKEIEGMKESDALTEAIREFSKEFPSLIKPLLTERDQYMVHVLQCIAAKAQCVVAVVGAGHLGGIEEYWNSDIDVAEICSIPMKKKGIPWSRWVVLAAGGVVCSLAVSRYIGTRYR